MDDFRARVCRHMVEMRNVTTKLVASRETSLGCDAHASSIGDAPRGSRVDEHRGSYPCSMCLADQHLRDERSERSERR